jgi:hypothetical protein
MSYERIDYTTHKGLKSSAYYDRPTQQAWDVFTQNPVAVTQNPLTNLYSEWVPTPVPAVRAVSAAPVKPERVVKPTRVVLQPYVAPWQIIPVGLFGLAMIWLELTFSRY